MNFFDLGYIDLAGEIPVILKHFLNIRHFSRTGLDQDVGAHAFLFEIVRERSENIITNIIYYVRILILISHMLLYSMHLQQDKKEIFITIYKFK